MSQNTLHHFSPARRVPQDPLAARATTEHPELPETQASPEAPASPESAPSTVPSTAVSSSRFVAHYLFCNKNELNLSPIDQYKHYDLVGWFPSGSLKWANSNNEEQQQQQDDTTEKRLPLKNLPTKHRNSQNLYWGNEEERRRKEHHRCCMPSLEHFCLSSFPNFFYFFVFFVPFIYAQPKSDELPLKEAHFMNK
jgi:hypothetical protein